MEELFLSLSENVSEECFDDIMGIVEDLVNYIRKTEGEPTETNKSGKLIDKVTYNKMREHNKAAGKAAANKLKINMDDEEWWKDEDNRKRYQKEFDEQAEKLFKKRRIKDSKTIPNSSDFVHNNKISEECFDEIISYIEAYLGEDYKSFRDEKLNNALQNLKDLRTVENSARRKADTNAKKLPGKLKKAQSDFETARSKFYKDQDNFTQNFKTPEGEKAHKIFQKVKALKDQGKGKEALEKYGEQYKQAKQAHDAKYWPARQKFDTENSTDMEAKRSKVADTYNEIEKNEENLRNSLHKVVDLDDAMNTMKRHKED